MTEGPRVEDYHITEEVTLWAKKKIEDRQHDLIVKSVMFVMKCSIVVYYYKMCNYQ